VAAEVLRLLLGEAGCPEWGTRFRDTAWRGMSVGLELERLVMEQTADEQARQAPAAALAVAGDEAQAAGQTATAPSPRAGSLRFVPPRPAGPLALEGLCAPKAGAPERSATPA